MKKNLKLLSMLLAVLLVCSLTCTAAFADLLPVPGGAWLNISVTAARDGQVPASYINEAGEEIWLDNSMVYWDGYEQQVCSVSYVNRKNQEIGGDQNLINLLDRNRDIGIKLIPLDGFYISELTLTSGDYTQSRKNLLSAAKASRWDASITLFFSDIAGSAGGEIQIDGDYVSSWGIGGDCTLNVTCSRISDDYHGVSYNSGDHYAEVPGGSGGYGAWTYYTEYMPQTTVNESDGSVWEFTGYKLSYENGPCLDVDANDELVIYANATLIAQWENTGSVDSSFGSDSIEGNQDLQGMQSVEGMQETESIAPAFTPVPSIPAVTILGL